MVSNNNKIFSKELDSIDINATLMGTTTLGLSGPGSNGNEGVFYIPQSFRTGASPLDAV